MGCEGADSVLLSKNLCFYSVQKEQNNEGAYYPWKITRANETVRESLNYPKLIITELEA